MHHPHARAHRMLLHHFIHEIIKQFLIDQDLMESLFLYLLVFRQVVVVR